jgi:hypothetical protein
VGGPLIILLTDEHGRLTVVKVMFVSGSFILAASEHYSEELRICRSFLLPNFGVDGVTGGDTAEAGAREPGARRPARANGAPAKPGTTPPPPVGGLQIEAYRNVFKFKRCSDCRAGMSGLHCEPEKAHDFDAFVQQADRRK